jgi:diaminohydroxyphosphoribosylaminopyrimidine deaminase/5-amino-6-(5-phosphoribosylamino)uracil reductase
VVVGCVDTFSAVSGKGIEMMREAGVNVRVGVLEEECRRLNRRFFTYHEKRRPYIILKWAESADGYIDASPTSAQRPVWLTNDACRRLVHKQRTTEGAVVIGVNTALLDNPSLTSRMWKGAQPLRVIIDPRLRAPETLTLLSDELPALILNAERDAELAPGKTLRRIDFGRGGVGAVLDELYRMQIQSIIVEGGSVTLRHFIDEGLWDEAWRYRGKAYLADGVRAPRLRYDPQEIKQMRTLTIDDAMLDIIEKKH